MATDRHIPKPPELDRLVFGGLIGLAAASVLQLADKSEIDAYQMVGVYCFAASMPLLVVGLVADQARQSGTRVAPRYVLIGLSGVVGAIAGFFCFLLHFGPWPAGMFLVLSLFSFVMVRRID